MKRQVLAVFTACQLLGLCAGMAAKHADAVLWTSSAVLLLPGSIIDIVLFKPGAIGNYWPKWTLFAVPIAVNMFLYLVVGLIMRARATRAMRQLQR